jgi:hypothetical protein
MVIPLVEVEEIFEERAAAFLPGFLRTVVAVIAVLAVVAVAGARGAIVVVAVIVASGALDNLVEFTAI